MALAARLITGDADRAGRFCTGRLSRANGRSCRCTGDALRYNPIVDAIRLLHFADLHVGIEAFGRIDPASGVNARVLDFLARFDELVAYALHHDADLVVFAGDAFKTRSPSPTYQRAFARRIKRLADAGVAVVLLVGNHDLPTMTQRASTVDIFRTLAVPNVTVGRTDRLHLIQTRRGPVQVITIPYPVRQRLLTQDECRGLSIEELDRALGATVTGLIADRSAQLDPSIPSLLTAHLSVSGATYSSERSVMIGRDVVIPQSVLTDAAVDYVALGHIHKHQSLNDGGYPPIVYAGSLERTDFGEEGQPKGFCWVNLARNSTAWEFIEVAARRLVTIRCDVRDAAEPLRALQQAVAGYDLDEAVVRLIINLRQHQEALLRDRDVRALLDDAYYIAGILRDVERKARLRLGNTSPEELTDQQLLERYLQTKGTRPERVAELLEEADTIFRPGSGPALT
jgi:exonuclease SbcD